MNNPERPCETSLDFNFAQCVFQTIMMRVGCQPHWRQFSVDGLPLCNNLSLLTQFANEFERVGALVKDKIIEDTKCLLPCSFMEYKVSEKEKEMFLKIWLIGTRKSYSDSGSRKHSSGSNICKRHNQGSQGGGGFPLHLPGGGLRGHPGPLHWIQLSYDLGLGCEDLGKSFRQKNIFSLK